MTRIHFIPAAIKLLLIVALAIQPVTVYANMAECCGDGSTCQGCSCCEVDNASDRRGCCDGPPAPRENRSCCVAETSTGSPTESRVRTSAPDHQRSSLTAVAGNRAPATPSGILRSCSCDQQSQPLSDTSSQRTSSESRHTIAVGYLAFDASLLNEVSASSAEHRSAVLPTPQHVTQVLLCIWRL